MRTDNLTKDSFPFWAVKYDSKYNDHEIAYFDRMEVSDYDGRRRFMYTKILHINYHAKTWKVDDQNIFPNGKILGYALSPAQAGRYHLAGTDKGDKYIKEIIMRIFTYGR
jgi:hypothetical protein